MGIPIPLNFRKEALNYENKKFNDTTNFFIKVCFTSLTHIQKDIKDIEKAIDKFQERID